MFHTTQVLIPPSVQEGTRLPMYNTSPTPTLHSQEQEEEEAQEKEINTEESKEGNIECSVKYSDKDEDNNNNKNCENDEFTYELQFCLEKDLHLRNTDQLQNDTSARTRTTKELDNKVKTIEKPNITSKERKSSIVELIHQEQVIRSEIVEDAQYMLEAVATWCKESNPTSINTQERATKLRLLQLKLQSRMSQWDYAAHANKEVYLNNGRRAWQTEVAMQTAAEELEQQRQKWRKQEAILFRRAVTFLTVSYDKEFHALCESEQMEWNALCDAEVCDKKEAEHRAWVNFMNSPEQRALAAEKERQEVLKRKKEARQARLHKIQQEKFIHNCHHGRNGQSLFTGPAPQKMCGKCQVRYDETKKCYVSMFNVSKSNTSKLGKAKSIISNATKNAKKERKTFIKENTSSLRKFVITQS